MVFEQHFEGRGSVNTLAMVVVPCQPFFADFLLVCCHAVFFSHVQDKVPVAWRMPLIWCTSLHLSKSVYFFSVGCVFLSSLSVFHSHSNGWMWVTRRRIGSFVTLLCYQINFSQTDSIRSNSNSVKAGRSSPLRWPSEKKCALEKLMKWKGLYYAAKSPRHVATRTAG